MTPDQISPALITYMNSSTRSERSAAFLRLYAVKIRDKSETSWEIPNTRASTLEDIANHIEVLAAKTEARSSEQLLGRRITLMPATTYSERVLLARAAAKELADSSRGFTDEAQFRRIVQFVISELRRAIVESSELE